MTDMDWLMYANIAVWIGLGAYLAFLLPQPDCPQPPPYPAGDPAQ